MNNLQGNNQNQLRSRKPSTRVESPAYTNQPPVDPYAPLFQSIASLGDRVGQLSRPYEHQTYVNPLQGVTENFAKGVYEAPGDLARMVEAMGEYSTGMRGAPFAKPPKKTLGPSPQHKRAPSNRSPFQIEDQVICGQSV